MLAMKKELLLIHANCQGEPLSWFLGRLPGVADRYEIRLVNNYLREPLPDAMLSRCGLFLYQHLGSKWGELASERVKKRLPASCRSLAFPSMFLKAYWPFWGHVAAWEYPDTLLDTFLEKGLPPAEARRIYLHSNVVPAHDLSELFERSVERERTKERHTPIHHVEHMLADHKEAMVFNTANHPGHGLLCWLGGRILQELGWPQPEAGVPALMPHLHPEFRLPVHPKVAEAMGYAFADEHTRYPVYGRDLTFAQYVDEYILARTNGINEFISFLRARALHEQGDKTGGGEVLA